MKTALRKRIRGFSLMQMTVAVVVAAIATPPIAMLVHEIGSRATDARQEALATDLAASLMDDVLSKAFEDPQAAPGSFGVEEVSRAGYDDVDDYDGFGRTVTTDDDDFRTQVTVESVSTDSVDGAAVTDGDSDVKRVTVTVSWNDGARLVRLVGLSSNVDAAPDTVAFEDGTQYPTEAETEASFLLRAFER